MKKIPKNFCWRPFTEIYMELKNNTFKPCCRFDHALPMSDIGVNLHADVRNDILADRWHPGCDYCQKQEQNNIKNSHRTQYTGPRDIKLIQENRFQPKTLDIALGKICNLACITCGEHCSSKWYSENRRMDPAAAKYKITENDVLTDIKIWKHVEQITLHGGEPMYMKSASRLIDWLIDQNLAEKIHISFYTNGTVINSNIMGKLLEFRKVSIGFSLDATGDRFDIIRWPAKWSEVQHNFLAVREYENIDVSINYVYSMLNACHFADDMHYFYDNMSNKIGVNVLINPDYYSACHLPEQTKAQLIQLYDKHTITQTGITCLQMPGSMDKLHVAIQKLRHLDKYRDTNSKLLFTEDLHYLFD